MLRVSGVTALVVTVACQATLGCGSDVSNGGSANTAGGGSAGSGAVASGGTSSSGAPATSSGSPGVAGGGGDAKCGARQPDSACVKDAMCLKTGCGMLNSQLDADGCLRTGCTSDSDCSSGELCYPGPVVAQADALLARFSPTCTASGSTCACTGKDARNGAPAYCVSETIVLGDWGCSWSNSLMSKCPEFSAWVTAAQTLLGGLSLSSGVASRAEACVTEAKQRYATACP